MNIKNYLGRLFMAFAKGKESTEGFVVKRYIGVAPVKVLAVNPDKATMEKLFNTTLEKDPVYFGKQNNFNGEEVNYARITLLVEPQVEGLDTGIQTITFFIRDEYRFTRDKSKIQVIDEYGNTGWASQADIQNHAKLLTSKGLPAKISQNYRPMYVGEEDLTNFFKNYLSIDDAFDYNRNTGVWSLKKDIDLDLCLARFEIDKTFKGDFSEVIEAATFRPDNKVQVLFGVKTDQDGKLMQSFFKEMVLRTSAGNDWSKLDASVKDRKNNGAYPTTEFEVCPLKEYSVTPTTFEEPAKDPFGEAPVNNPWFK